MSENSNDIVKQVFVDISTGEELPVTTKYVIRTLNVPTRMRVPLYENGVMVTPQRLLELGLQLKSYTREEVQEAYCNELYQKDAQGDGALQKRVRQYKGLLDDLELPYDASQDLVMMTIQTKPIPDSQKAAYALTLKTVYDAITTNLQYLGSSRPHMDTYEMLADLIKYLPKSEE